MAPHRHALPDGRILDNTHLAKELGISRQTLTQWLKTSPLEDVLHRRPTRHPLLTLPDGRCVQQRALARELGMSESTLSWRRKRGQSPLRSTVLWCHAHDVVLTRRMGQPWTWEPLLPGMLARAQAYAQQFGYRLTIIQGACPQCAEEEAA